MVFICKLENTNISIDQSMLLKYDGIIPDSDDNTFNSFINNVENSFNLIFMNENDSKCYKKLTNNLKIIILFFH